MKPSEKRSIPGQGLKADGNGEPISRVRRSESNHERGGNNDTQGVIESFRAGSLTRDAAIDALVAAQLQSTTATLLPSAERAKLESHLRALFESDPTLSQLLDAASDR